MKINQSMLDAITAGVVAKLTDAIVAGISEASQPAPVKLASAGQPVSVSQPRHRAKRRVASGNRASYVAVKTGKAGAKLLGGARDGVRAALGAIVASGKAGCSIPALEASTGRTTKQLENDVHWLRTRGMITTQYPA